MSQLTPSTSLLALTAPPVSPARTTEANSDAFGDELRSATGGESTARSESGRASERSDKKSKDKPTEASTSDQAADQPAPTSASNESTEETAATEETDEAADTPVSDTQAVAAATTLITTEIAAVEESATSPSDALLDGAAADSAGSASAASADTDLPLPSSGPSVPTAQQGEELAEPRPAPTAVAASVTEVLPADKALDTAPVAEVAAVGVAVAPANDNESPTKETPPQGATSQDTVGPESAVPISRSGENSNQSAEERSADLPQESEQQPAETPPKEIAKTAAAESSDRANGTSGSAKAPIESSAPPITVANVSRASTAAAEAPRGGEPRAETPNVDPARFVTRVARAFDLAQERGGGPIQLRLSPPELGSIQLRIEVADGVMTASIETENHAARNALLENLPQLRERLAEQDIRLEKFDVDVRDQGRQPDLPNQRDREPQNDNGSGRSQPRERPAPPHGAAETGVNALPITIRFDNDRINVVA
ncbi:flagellar hook-length control protein FliK [Botrimarina hoheduenensis]|uniref:Flagellar hook-length control protein FliK n=1 Tax=Botrimarina hoheduenensis TaxID=2528000 RepID=A0A5C5VX02_9BACT|nr:flagellar hook-length control protein FliK [Botrimarina hoheduenensis]TWT43186.1 Flagellar hook-length control protein FliK [Botrimarina hoheduenensis]